jgi:PAS domain S-box-containing protein
MLRTIIDLLPVNIYAKDLQSRFLVSNTHVARGMGCTPAQLKGKTDFDFFPKDMAQAFYNDEQAIIKSTEPLMNREERVLDKTSGVIRTYLTTKVPIRDIKGNISGIVGVGHDVTEQRESEKKRHELKQQLVDEILQREQMAAELRLSQKLESVGRLASGVAHEINTPIQFVNDSLYFLQSACEDINTVLNLCRAAKHDLEQGQSAESILAKIEEAMNAIDLEFLQGEIPKAFERTFDGANRVAGIVRAMKEFAHPDAVEQSPADINQALQTTLTVATNEYKYLAAVNTEFGEVPMVVCNIGELNQVFLNMIVNAAHAIHDSGKDISTGVISISTKLAGDVVEVSIADNGCGIPTENLEKIFDPFFTTKEVGRGTGQGLAITRSIVIDKHGGDIRVNSKPGEGTAFTLCLPVNGRQQSSEEN